MRSCAALREGGEKKEVLLLMDSWGQIHFPHSAAVSGASVNTIQISAALCNTRRPRGAPTDDRL